MKEVLNLASGGLIAFAFVLTVSLVRCNSPDLAVSEVHIQHTDTVYVSIPRGCSLYCPDIKPGTLPSESIP